MLCVCVSASECVFFVVVAAAVVVIIIGVVVLYRRVWRENECRVCVHICKRRFFSLLLILKSEMLGYIVCVPMDINGGRYFFPFFQSFFSFLSFVSFSSVRCVFFARSPHDVFAFAARDVIVTRGHTCCQSTIR